MKTLIIYYSRAGENYTSGGLVNLPVGNTEVVANTIANITNGDCFKIDTIKTYPQSYSKCTEVAKTEQNEGLRPKLKEYLDNIDDYDIVYVGYPNWWGTMPMAMFTQLEKLNFNGKTVMPFCTHEGSKMGHSEEDIIKICKGAKVKKGLPIQGSTVKESKSKIEKWINEGVN
jgi:flavodoxin